MGEATDIAGPTSYEKLFEQALHLMRSTSTNDIRKAIHYLEFLANNDPSSKKFYLYYLAVGNSQVKQYKEAMKYCKAFLAIDPHNQDVISLQVRVTKQQKKDMRKHQVIEDGALFGVVFGAIGLVGGFGLALLKKREPVLE